MDTMKLFSHKLAKGAFLAVGIPYGIVIVTNLVSGWPCSQEGEDKYRRALQPGRVLKVTYAVAGQMSLLKLLPVYLKYTSLYRTANNVVKDIKYGVNENTLDVWTPYPVTSHTESDDVSSAQLISDPVSRPVVVFVYGGAWGSGDKNMYCLLAQQIIDHLGAVVVIPNYSTFPKGEVKGMVRDIRDTIAFIKSPYFGQLAPDADPQKVILFGHSAGAHLCALSTLDLTERLKGDGGPAKDEMEATDGRTGREEEIADVVQYDGAFQNSSFSADELLSSVRGVVGLGGVYHIMDHYHFESWRGLEDLSPMWRAMNGLENFDLHSPTERVAKMSTEQIRRLPPFYLIHGSEDKVVPLSSSEKFTTALAEKEVDVTLKVIAEGGHAELVVDMMDSGRKFYETMNNLLMDFGNRL